MFPTLLQNLTTFSCGKCSGRDIRERSEIDYVNDGNHGWANKRSFKEVKEHIEEDLHAVTFPIHGRMELTTYLNSYAFVPVVKHPGVVFFIVKESIKQQVQAMLQSVGAVWPILIVNLVLIMLSGLIIWGLVGKLIQ